MTLLPVIKYESVLLKRMRPARTRRTSRMEMRVGPSSSSVSEPSGFDEDVVSSAGAEGGWEEPLGLLGFALGRERRFEVAMMVTAGGEEG